MTTPKAGVVVILRELNVEVARATTDANGLVRFQNVPVGTYNLRIETPDGYAVVEGHVENSLADADAGNNEISQVNIGPGFNYGFVGGVDVSKNNTAVANVVISQGIFLDFNVVWISGTSVVFSISMTSIKTDPVAVGVTWMLNRDDGDGTMVPRAGGGSVVLTIPAGQFTSNAITVNTGLDDGTITGFPPAPAAGDILELLITSKPATAVLANSFITLAVDNQG